MSDKISVNIFSQISFEKINKKYLISGFQNTRVTVLALILLNLCITLPLALKLNIWVDEAYSLHTTGKDIEYAIQQSLHFELQPPLYFILLTLWRHLNGSIFFARLFSVICTVLTIYSFSRLSKIFISEIHPFWGVCFVAINPFLVWAAVEIRLYAFWILLCSLLILTFFYGHLSEAPKTRSRLAYIVLSVAVLYTQYYSAFLLLANGIVLLVLKHWRSLQNYVFDMAGVSLCFSPMLLVISHQLQEHTDKPENSESFLEIIKTTLQMTINFIVENPGLPIPEKQKMVLYFLSISPLLFLFIKYWRHFTSKTIAIYIISIVLFTSFLALKGFIGNYSVAFRHMTVIFIPSVLFVFCTLSIIERKYRTQIILVWMIIVLSLNTLSLYINYRPMAKRGDYARVASYIMSYEKPNQPVLVFNAEAAIPLTYYYSGVNPVISIPKEEDFQSFNPQDWLIKNEQEIIDKIPRQSNSFWLVKNEFCSYKIPEVVRSCELLDVFSKANYITEKSENFYRANVKLLYRK